MKRTHRDALTRAERSALARRRRALAHLERVQQSGGPRRLLGRAITWPAVFVLAMALGALLGTSGFAPGPLETLAVRGTRVLTPEDVAAATGMARGTALDDLDPAELAETLTSHAWIAEARAVPLPGGQLVLRVVEHEAVAILAGPEPWAVDAAGVPFAPAPPGPRADLPQLVPDQRPPNGEAAPALARAVALARALAARGLPAPVEIAIAAPEDPEGFRLQLADLAPQVILGHEDLDARLDALAELLDAELPAVSGASRVDLRFEGQAVLDGSPSPDGAAQAAATRGDAAPSNSRPTG